MRRVPALAARAVIFVGALIALLGGGAARAGEPPKIVIVAAQDEDAIVTQLRAELRVMGFNVVVADASSAPYPREELEKTARDNSAVAAILVRPSRAGLEVWVIDRITGKTLLRDVVGAEGAAGRDATVALRAVELLRASLMEIDAPHALRGEVPSPPAIREIVGLAPPAPAAPASAWPPPPAWPPPAARPQSPAQRSSFARSSPPTPHERAPKGPVAPPSSRIFSVDVAPAVVGSPGGLAALPALELGVHVWLQPWITADLCSFLPIGSVLHEAVEGQSSNRVALFLAGARVTLARPDATWVPTLAAGGSLIWLHTDGVGATPQYKGTSNDGFSGAPFLRPGLLVALSTRLSLHADLLAGVAVRGLVVDYAGRDAATWGTPFFAGSLGIEISSP